MPPKRISPSTELDRLENIVTQFIVSAKNLVESDHEKVALMYDFLFVGKPDAAPPVLPFVSLMQRNTDHIDSFKRGFNKIIWMGIGLLLTAAGIFTVAVYNHVFVVQIANAVAPK
jgi:hypothetical protein